MENKVFRFFSLQLISASMSALVYPLCFRFMLQHASQIRFRSGPLISSSVFLHLINELSLGVAFAMVALGIIGVSWDKKEKYYVAASVIFFIYHAICVVLFVMVIVELSIV